VRSGARLLDFAAHGLADDPRLWSPDRLHANAEGHARIADALAHTLELPGSDRWSMPMPPPARRSARDHVAEDLPSHADLELVRDDLEWRCNLVTRQLAVLPVRRSR
jgi:hypothetical protein